MKLLVSTILLSLFLPLFAPSASAAEFSPLQIGIIGDDGLQLVDSHIPVVGLRLNLPISMNDTVAGLDAGLMSYATTFSGIRLNAMSWTEKTIRGVDVSLISMGTDDTEVDGIQIAGLGVASKMRGIQAGIVSYAAILYGLQIGLWSNAGDLCGLQIGLANFADSPQGSIQLGVFNSSAPIFEMGGIVRGLQIGIVNLAETLHGVQIGLLNFVSVSSIPCLPLIRAAF